MLNKNREGVAHGLGGDVKSACYHWHACAMALRAALMPM